MIEVKTVYNLETQKKASRFAMKKTMLNPINIIYPIMFFAGLILCISSLWIEAINVFPLGLMLVLFAAIWPLLLFLLVLYSGKSATKSNREFHTKSDFLFRFEKDSFYVEKTKNGEILLTEIRPYNELFKMCETQTDFFLFINKSAAYVIPKNDFVAGSPEELREIIKSHLDARCKTKGKN